MKASLMSMMCLLFLCVSTAVYAQNFEPNMPEMNHLSKPMPTDLRGPFVSLPDGAIATMEKGIFHISQDEGKTWKSHTVLDPKKYTESDETAMIFTREGTLVYAFLNIKEIVRGKEPWGRGKVEDWILPSYVITSTDQGATWSEPVLLQRIWCGALRSMIQMESGRLVLVGQSVENWTHITITYVSDDQGKTWKRSNILNLGGRGDHSGAMEATIVERKDRSIYMLIRTTHGLFYESVSTDGGLTWSKPVTSGIRNNSCCGALSRLADGRISLLWNMIPDYKAFGYKEKALSGVWDGRSRVSHVYPSRQCLLMAFSSDECKTWTDPIVIADNPPVPGEVFWKSRVSYPYLFEMKPGVFWITTMQGKLRMTLTDQEITQLTQEKKDAEKTMKRVVFFGDSTTGACSSQFQYDFKNERNKLHFHNASVGDYNIIVAKSCFEQNVLHCRPTVLVLQFGINESMGEVRKNSPVLQPKVSLDQFKETLKYFISEAKKQNVRVILLTTNQIRWSEQTRKLYGKSPFDPKDPDSLTDKYLRSYNEAIRQLATEEKVELVDIFAEYDRIKKEKGEKGIDDLLQADGIHTNKAGYQLVYDKLKPLLISPTENK